MVESGDTIESISKMLGIDALSLASINGFNMNKNLTPGEYIVVPNRDNENMYFTRYTIKKGDTIYSIARSIGVSPKDLLRLNGLNESDTIYENDTIFIPKENVIFYVTGNDDTLNDVLGKMNITPSDLASQNSTIYLTNDQLLLYRK